MNIETMIAIVLITCGLLIRYLIGRRRFNRRNVAGLQQFPSFQRAIYTKVLETLFSMIAKLFLLAGLLLLALAGFNHLLNLNQHENELF